MRGPEIASLAAWTALWRPRGPEELGGYPEDAASFLSGSAVPLLLPLDDLAMQRFDWHPALAALLLDLGCDASPLAQAAAADFLVHANCGPLFVQVAEAIVAAQPGAGSLAHPERKTSPVLLADQLGRLRQSYEVGRAEPYKFMLQSPTYRFVELAKPADALTLARESLLGAEQGKAPLRAPLYPRWRPLTLGWLAEAAFWSPMLAGWLPELLLELWQASASRSAILQLLAVVSIKVELAPVCEQLFATPIRDPEESALRAALQAVLQEELETPPPGSAAG